MKLAIYAHFNDSERIVAFAWPYLKCLKELGHRIIFVSNSPICRQDTDRLESNEISVILRENSGLDFGMWKAALAEVELDEVNQLILTNSSIVGPLHPLGPIFETAKTWQCGFWGMTENTFLRRHLQSYFLVFEREVLRSEFFRLFWENVVILEEKQQIILSYEIGLSSWMSQHGFEGKAYITEDQVWSEYRKSRTAIQLLAEVIRGKLNPPENVTLEFPDFLLSMGMPFLKCSLFDRPSKRIPTERAKALFQAYR